MSAIADRRTRFEQVARLRRAERELPDNHDLAEVRDSLEAEIGATVSQRLAASLLGVSHTALARWIAAGDLPLVEDASGRTQVPVPALLDLYELVEQERTSGTRTRHVLEPAMSAGRARAQLLDVEKLVPEARQQPVGHRRADLRSLAYHRAVARLLRRTTVDDARRVVRSWRKRGTIDPRHAEAWERVLQLPLAEVRRVIGADTEEARALRQTSPFAGLLSEPERRKILAELR